MKPIVRHCLLIAAAIFAAPAAAQEPPPAQGEEEIVVTGTRDAERQIRDFVGALAPAPGRGQISRFESQVCPAAAGLPAAQKDAVASRIRSVALAAGIPVGAAACTPNLLVVVTPDKKAFIEALARQHPYYFSRFTPGEIRRLARQEGPATAWHIERVLSADGTELPMDDDELFYVNHTIRPATRMTPGGRRTFAAGIVVVETKALVGLTTTQLADYAAMRVLVRTDPSRLAASDTPSILRILDAPMGSAVPITLTRWDFGFLRGLYASPEGLYAGPQRSEIGRQLGEELKGPGDKPE
jgi:hypothetical protein